jgi:large subunit ribosomal protein L29
MTKAVELRELGIDELQQRLRELDDQLFRLRLRKSMGQLESAGPLQTARRDVARVKTILRERERGQKAGR